MTSIPTPQVKILVVDSWCDNIAILDISETFDLIFRSRLTDKGSCVFEGSEVCTFSEPSFSCVG
jgi:hypothetical protein